MLSGKISASAWRGLFLFALLLGLLFCFGLVGDFGKAEAEAGRGAGIAKPEEVIEIEGRNNVWSGEKVIEEAVVIKEGALLRIQKGTTIKFKREEGRPAPFILIEDGGLLVANGTEKDWIKFTSDQEKSAFSLIFEGSNRGKGFSGYLRYAQISKAGGVYEYEAEPSQQVRRSFPLVPKLWLKKKKLKKKRGFPFIIWAAIS